MQTIGFIGGYDKSNLIIYIAKILSTIQKRVLIIDSTALQKTKYIVPTMAPSKTYVTNYEDIDIAVGFYSYEAIKSYLGVAEHEALAYDYVFIDIDSPEAFEAFNIKSANKNYFVTNFDTYSIKRGIEILSGITEPMTIKKIFFSKDMTKEEDEYFNYISLGAKVNWEEEKIYFPFEQGDESVIIENQIVRKIKLKKLSKMYKDSLVYLTEEILDNPKENSKLEKMVKQMEKGAI